VYCTVGGLLLASSFIIWVALPPPESFSKTSREVLDPEGDKEDNNGNGSSGISGPSWWSLLLIPTLWLVILNLFTAAASIGFITATLEGRLDVVRTSQKRQITQINDIYKSNIPLHTNCLSD
jgi:hypothetical protein